MQKYVLVLSLICAFTSIGCDAVEEEAPEEVLVPLAEGNRWTMSRAKGDVRTESFIEVAEPRVVDDTLRFLLVDRSFGESSTLYVVHNGADGFYMYDPYGLAHFFKFPVPEEERYTAPDRTTGGERTIEVVRETITVPAGSFDSYRYEAYEDSFFWLAPGVGFVKFSFGDFLAGELVSYELH